eukprot:356953-Rhodomonas_salina.4
MHALQTENRMQRNADDQCCAPDPSISVIPIDDDETLDAGSGREVRSNRTKIGTLLPDRAKPRTTCVRMRSRKGTIQASSGSSHRCSFRADNQRFDPP